MLSLILEPRVLVTLPLVRLLLLLLLLLLLVEVVVVVEVVVMLVRDNMGSDRLEGIPPALESQLAPWGGVPSNEHLMVWKLDL